MKILEDSNKYIREIIHISDIHIRNESTRYVEYTIVFENLFKEIKLKESVRNNEAIVVITGDFFHHKITIGKHGIKLFTHFITSLCDIAPTFVILGNHDFEQHKIEDEIDFLEAFDIKHNNFNYLDTTGLYEFGNIGFGVVDVKDSLRIGSGSGASDDLPDFPKPEFSKNVTTSIGLFHGTIKNSKVSKNRILVEGYPMSWIDIGYDFFLLGDIHKMQILETPSSMIAAYSGSLIQQNFGESLFHHGFLTWNVENKKVTMTKVKNEYGFLKVCYVDSLWKSEDVSLKEFVKRVNFPSHIKVRIIGKYSLYQYNELVTILSNSRCVFEDVSVKAEQFFEDESDNDIRLDVSSIELFNNFIKHENIDDKYKTIPNSDYMFTNVLKEWNIELKTRIGKKNTEIEKSYLHYRDIEETPVEKLKQFTLKHISWNGLLCYIGYNHLDFTNFENSTNLISAKNGGGKTSLLDIICVAIFGKSSKSKTQKNLISKGITKDTAATNITIKYKDDTYKIERVFDKTGKQKYRCGGVFKYHAELDCWKTVALDSPQTNAWVSYNLGTIQQFLTTTMISQNNDNDFLSMKSNDQKDYLEKIFGIQNLNSKTEYLIQTKTALHSIKKNLDLAFSLQKMDTIENGNEIKKKLDETKREVNFLDGRLKAKHFEKEDLYVSVPISDLQKTYQALEIERKKIEEQVENIEYVDKTTLIKRMAEIVSTKNQYSTKHDSTSIDIDSDTFENLRDDYLENGCMSIFQTYFKKLKKLISIQKPEYDGDLRTIFDDHTKYSAKFMAMTKSTIDVIQFKKKCLELENKEESLFKELDVLNMQKKQPNINRNEVLFVLDQVNSQKEFVSTKVQEKSKLEEKIRLKNLLKKNQENIDSLDTVLSTVPFNPECIACRSQALRVQHVELLKMRVELTNKFSNFVTDDSDDSDDSDDNEELRKLKIWLENFYKLYSKYKQYSKVANQWCKYDTIQMKCVELEDTLSNSRRELRKLRQLEKAVGEYDETKQRIEYIEDVMKKIKEYKLQREEKISLYIHIYRIADMIHQKLLCIELSNQEHDKLNSELKYIKQVVSSKQVYDQILRVSSEIEEIRSLMHDKSVLKTVLDQQYIEFMKNYETGVQLENTVSSVIKKIETVSELIDICNRYREWIYNEYILPNIVKKANNLISRIEPRLELCFKFEDENIEFTAKNEFHEVPIEKTSGFEYFILSLCLRISLISLTGNQNHRGQLIIDEGFTTCDANHLEKIPHFLRLLLNQFESIILVSHLEKIQESVDNTIHIKNHQLRI